MAAQDAAARKDQREVTRLDHLVDLLDDAWLAATPKKARWYARREIA
jgi:hypothetical protein